MGEVHRLPAFAEHDSLYRLLLKCCAPDPNDRFLSAEELRLQMLGVLREVVAQDAKTGPATTSATSLLFEEPSISTDRLEWWSLPRLRPDPHDPQAALVRDVRAMEPHERFEALRAADPATPDVQLELARTALDRGDNAMVEAVTNNLLREDPWEWRAVWIQGLAALAEPLHAPGAGEQAQQQRRQQLEQPAADAAAPAPPITGT